LDISDLKEILRILEAQDITEFELEQDGVKLRVCRSSGAGAVAAVTSHLVPGSPRDDRPSGGAPGAGGGRPGEPAANGTLVKSPIVGTFYRAPTRTARPSSASATG